MVSRSDFRDDPAWISAQLQPSVPVSDVNAALEILLDLGLLQRNDDGTLQQQDPTLTTGHEVQALAVGNFHRQMMARAAESIETINHTRRDLSAITICINEDNLKEAKRRIHLFCESMLDLGDRDDDGVHVYQLNVQFFPLTQPLDPSDES